MTDAIISDAQDLYTDAEERLSTLKDKAIAEARFSRLGEQWDDAAIAKRKREERPIVTINKLPSFLRQIVNEARMNRPSIIVSPVDGGADPATAEVMQALIRHIMRKSNADVAFDTALEHAVTFGFGFFRIFTDYEHQESFDQGAYIGRITDPTAVTWDVDTSEIDASDWRYAFISEQISEREFRERFPKHEPVSFVSAEVANAKRDDNVTIVEYWRKEEKKEKLLLIRAFDGSVTPWRKSKLDEAIESGRLIPGLFEVARERDTEICKVTQYLLSGDTVLEENEWPGYTIPICPVWGTDITIDGERYLQSAVHDAIDAQRLYNVWRAATTEMVALAPKVPFIVPVGSIPAYEEHKWQTSNSVSWPYLQFDPEMAQGLRPSREPGPQVPAAAIGEALAASDDMKAVTGIHDASLGKQGNETSGLAINARKHQGAVSNFHFYDNLTRAVQYAGKCLVDVIPHLYGERETMRIIGDDGAEKVVQLMAGAARQDPVTGEPMVFDLTAGHYDVSTKAGTGYATSREHALDAMIKIAQSAPDVLPIIGDKVVELMDFPGSDEIAERIRNAMQPAAVQPPIPQQAMGAQQGTPMPAQGPMMNGR